MLSEALQLPCHQCCACTYHTAVLCYNSAIFDKVASAAAEVAKRPGRTCGVQSRVSGLADALLCFYGCLEHLAELVYHSCKRFYLDVCWVGWDLLHGQCIGVLQLCGGQVGLLQCVGVCLLCGSWVCTLSWWRPVYWWLVGSRHICLCRWHSPVHTLQWSTDNEGGHIVYLVHLIQVFWWVVQVAK
jgi:hypothetical protein